MNEQFEGIKLIPQQHNHEDLRFALTYVKVPMRARIAAWWRGVRRQLKQFPPAKEAKFKPVRPGEEGYEQAAFHSLIHKIEFGKTLNDLGLESFDSAPVHIAE